MDDIQKALDKAAQTKSGGLTVLLRGGTHYLKDTLTLGPQHSNLTLAAYPGEKPVVSGGKQLNVQWKPYNVKAGGPNIYVADVKGQVTDVPGLQINGERATRARYPNLPGSQTDDLFRLCRY